MNLFLLSSVIRLLALIYYSCVNAFVIGKQLIYGSGNVLLIGNQLVLYCNCKILHSLKRLVFSVHSCVSDLVN